MTLLEKKLKLKVDKLRFILDQVYDALGPAADDIMEDAEDAWEAKQARKEVQDASN